MIDPILSAHLASIGAKGGAKRADYPNRSKLARRAAKASWSTKARAKRLGIKSAKEQEITPQPENKV